MKIPTSPRHRTLAASLVASASLLLTSAIGQTLSSEYFPARAGIQLKNEDMSAAALTKAQATGVKYVRKGIYWDTIETSPGVFNWTQTDTWITSMEAKGFSMIITVVWNNRDYEDIWDRAIVTAAGREAYANFVATLATRYAGKDIIWEIWNEPNLRSFWHENAQNVSNTDAMAEEYTELVKVAVPAMKAANPNCRVVAGSISALWTDSFNWFDRCIEVGILTSGIDGISVHPYGFRWPELALAEGYAVVRQKMNAAGATTMPIITSEVGYPESWITERGVAAADVKNVQAWQFVRQNLVDAIAGLPVTIWYELTDASYGVLETNLTERPTFLAAQVMTTELAGYQFKNTFSMASALDYGAVFENTSGAQKLVVWTTPDKTKPLLQRLETPHAVTLPLAVSGTYEITDIFGAKTSVNSPDGNLQITITGAPQYIPLKEAVSNYRNVAAGRPATISSGSGATKLTDGIFNDASRWMSSGTEGYPQWAEIDLGGTFEIDKVVFSQHSQRTSSYQVEAWNGTAWSTVASSPTNTAQEITVTFAPTVASKVRFTVTSGVYYLKAWELAVYGKEYVPAPYENVSQGKTATVSSGSGATKLTDGLFTDASRWMSGSTAGYPQWAEIDLGGTYSVDKVVFSQPSQRTSSYQVEVWSGTAWSVVNSSPTNTAQEITATFPAVSTSRVRFVVNTGSYYLKVWEMAVWGRGTGGGSGGGTPAPTEFLHEAESLSYTATDTVTEFTDSLASAGSADKLDANAVNDQVSYTVPVAQAGTYSVKVRYKTLNSRGIFQLSVGSTAVGSPVDQYATTSTWNEVTVGTIGVGSAGNQTFTFKVTGKNAASSGYNLTIDSVKLIKQ
jgi:hypothetical protein